MESQNGKNPEQFTLFHNFMPNMKYKRMLRDNRAEVETANRDVLKAIAFIVAVMLGAMFLLGIVSGRYHLLPLYGGFCALSFLAFFFCERVLPNLPERFSVLPLFYAYILSMYVFSIYLSFFVLPRGTQASFIAMMIAVPFIVIDRPIRIIMVIVTADLVFIVCQFLKNPLADASDNTINCAVFSLVGLYVGRYIGEIKLQAIDTQRQLELQILYDSVTGLGSRRSLFSRLAELESPLGLESLYGVLMVDIDWFKQYNDRYGHQAGDNCLKILGGSIAHFCRENRLEAFRYGGEEFLLISTCHGEVALMEAAAKLLGTVWELGIPAETSHEGRVTVSIGCASAERLGSGGYERCISNADQALYSAKRRGRNRVVNYRDISGQEGFASPREPGGFRLSSR